MNKILKGFNPKMNGTVHDSFESQHGTLYKFVLTFEDGTDADANSKSSSPTWKIGSEWTVTEQGQYRNAKQVPDNNYAGGGKSFKEDPLRQQYIIAQSSIKISVDVIDSGKYKNEDGVMYELKDLENLTDRIMTIINKLANKHNQ